MCMKTVWKWIFAFVLSVMLLGACDNGNRVLEVKDVNNSFFSFYKDLANTDSASLIDSVRVFEKKYPYFFKLYTEGIINVGNVSSNTFPVYLNRFLRDSIYNEVLDTLLVHFAETRLLESQLSVAFGRLSTALPKIVIPDVYWIMSGFNEPIAVGDGLEAVSLEHYLGANHLYYSRLGVYNYLRNRKEADRIPLDVLEGWLRTEFSLQSTEDRLLDEMIYEGKLTYLLQACFPQKDIAYVLGYTNRQKEWALKNEAAAWTAIIEWKHLFSTSPDVLRQYVGEAPYTRLFGEESAPQLGRYIGYRIVEGYLKKHPETTIETLFGMHDSQLILQESSYKP